MQDMKDKYIKKLLREALDDLFLNENEENKEKDNNDDKKNDGTRKDYSDVKRAFSKIGGPSMVDIMILTGIPDDEKGTNRSLFRKKVKQIKNTDGSIYQFTDKELDEIRSKLNIDV